MTHKITAFTSLVFFYSIHAYTPLKLEPIRNMYAELGLPSTGTLEELNDIGQKNLIRKPGLERWHLEDSPKDKEKREAIVAELEKVGLTQRISPNQKNYDYIVILGAREKEMAKRIKFAQEFLEPNFWSWSTVANFFAKCGAVLGLTAEKKIPTIVGLASSRPLDPAIETLRFGNTEAAVMKGLLSESLLKDYPTDIIDVPMKIDAQGKPARPNTDDTLYAWLAKKPVPGSCLVISSQPYVHRQTKAFECIVPKEFLCEGVGAEANKNEKVAIYLDELARTMYQEKQLLAAHPEYAAKSEN